MDNKTPIDVAAGVLALGSIVEILPAVASIATIVWMALRIYQTILDIKRKRSKNGQDK